MIFEPLAKRHDRTAFDCGNDEMNRYLQTMASQHAKKGIARTHVLADEAIIKAFYTLSNMSILNHDGKVKGYPRDIPAILIGRLAVDKQYQGLGLSKQALSDALKGIKQYALFSGIAFVVIDAKNDSLAKYYERFGFMPTDNPHRLVMSVNKLLNC